jgi:flagellar basal-body rod modification protein FlgD
MDTDSFGKDSFLKLLTTQMANQDPLSPSEPTEFISQLAQFTSLEQLVNVNEGLNMLAVTQTAATSAQMVSYVGKEVTFASDSMYLAEQGQSQTLSYELGSAADNVDVQVLNESGKVVRTMKVGGQGKGDQRVEFDGNDDDGNPLPEGMYTLEINAKNDDGEVTVNTRDKAMVKGVTFKGGFPQLLLEDGRVVTLNQVLSVTNGNGEDVSVSEDGDSGVNSTIEAAEKLLHDLTADSDDVFEEIIPDSVSLPLDLPGDNSDEDPDYDAQAE